MPNPTGKKRGISLDALIESFNRNGGQIKATALEFGCHPTNVTRRILKAYDAGDERIDPELIFKNRLPVGHVKADIARARVELGMRNEAKVKKGDWRKPSLITKCGHGPIILGLFGDPHLDNPGTDLDLFEEEISRLDPERRVYGACVGDMFDNWVGFLQREYKSAGDPGAAWTLFQYWMENHPFLFAVSGNHDLWASGTADFLVEFMRTKGILFRRSGGRFIIDLGSGRPITVAMRHIWQGNSQYSEAHNLKRAVTFGHTDDDVIVGGHFHKGECRTHIRPSDQKISKLVSVSAFKRLDDYANDRGFMSADTPPVVWMVLDDREPYTSHMRAQYFYDFNTAQSVLQHQLNKNEFGGA